MAQPAAKLGSPFEDIDGYWSSTTRLNPESMFCLLLEKPRNKQWLSIASMGIRKSASGQKKLEKRENMSRPKAVLICSSTPQWWLSLSVSWWLCPLFFVFPPHKNCVLCSPSGFSLKQKGAPRRVGRAVPPVRFAFGAGRVELAAPRVGAARDASRRFRRFRAF